jgi:hypothetical protein
MELSPSWEAASHAALKNFPTFYGTRWFITVFTRALQWFLSWARSIQSIPPHPISLRSILILSTHLHLGLPSGLLPSGFPTNILYDNVCIVTQHIMYYVGHLLQKEALYKNIKTGNKHSHSVNIDQWGMTSTPEKNVNVRKTDDGPKKGRNMQ